MRRVALVASLLLLFVGSLKAQDQSVTVTGSAPYSGNVNYSQTLTIKGLPAGCVASISGSVITITGCTATTPPITVSTTCPSTSVQVGKTLQCTATVNNSTNQSVTWTTSNAAVATVSTSGLVTGKGVGNVIITAVSQADNTKSGSVSLQGIQTQLTVVTQDATNPVPMSNGSVLVQPTGDPPIAGVGTNKLAFMTAGQFFDYLVPVTSAGLYTLSARLGTDAGSNVGSLTVHFEMPVGTRITPAMTLTGTNLWTTVVSAQAASYIAGLNSVRLVVDSIPTTTNVGNSPAMAHWFQLTSSGSTPPSTTLTITSASLPPAVLGQSYFATLTASGGKLPYTWSISSGALPTGLSLSSAGVISGIPTSTNSSSFEVTVKDASGAMARQNFGHKRTVPKKP